MSQLLLPLSLPTVFSADNFVVSDCNEAAYNQLLNFTPQFTQSNHSMYLYGKKSSGKSHLASIWAGSNGAKVIAAYDIQPSDITTNLVVEDIENCNDERELFHLFNHCKDIGAYLLMTSSCLPSELPFTLPDLVSRLRGCPLATIQEPDDKLLSAVMRKQFSDRQLLLDDDLISYLIVRGERSFLSVNNIVEALDSQAFSEQKTITIPFAKRVLGY